MLLAGEPWAPEELTAWLVRWVVDRVAEREGGPADAVAVTRPASWDADRRNSWPRRWPSRHLDATFLTEPQAAAWHYAAAERVEAGSPRRVDLWRRHVRRGRGGQAGTRAHA